MRRQANGTGGSDSIFDKILAVPDFSAFPGVDALECASRELVERYPDVVRRNRVGTSRLGEPIHALTVGDGEKSAIVFGGVHPNEPIGGLTSIHLLRSLCEDSQLRQSLGLTWHVIPCIDPDGTRLNENWFAGPFTRSHYGQNFYRPPADEQVEWTFPFQHKQAYFDRVLPETLTLMRLIDATQPTFMCSLHNGELGGVYYYLSRPLPGVYDSLHAIPKMLGLPLDHGEPEAPFVRRLDEAVFEMIRSEEAYDFTERMGLDPTRDAGASSASYAERHGTLTLVSELPYWVDERAQDQSPVEKTYADLLRGHAEQLSELTEVMALTLAAVEGDLVTQSPFLRATRKFLPQIQQVPQSDRHRADQAESQRPGTVAERHSLDDNIHCFRLRYAGMLLRGLNGEIAVGNHTAAIREQAKSLGVLYDEWCQAADEATPSEHVPIGTLVANQFGAIIVTASELR